MIESSVQQQIELIKTLIASPDKRKKYLADPDGYLRSEGVTPAPDLKDSLAGSLKSLDDEFEKLGDANPFATDTAASGGATTMRGVAAAVVSAAAAVVSAAAAVTTATSAAKMAK